MSLLGAAAGAQTITPIADIHDNISTLEGTVVTVEGQVYIPTDYRGNNPVSGFIQDGSGRGINIFGTGADDPALLDTSNIVRVTGTVELFFTTVEIIDPTSIELVSTGNPPLQPRVLGTGAAASADWEGTFIQVTGTISAADPGAGPGTNYTVNDGTGPIDIRVVNTLGAATFTSGQTITGRGAGGAFGSTFQVLVGHADDVFEGGGGPDTTPPLLTSASASDASTLVASFSEALDPETSQNATNYEVFETANAGNTVPVTNASLAGTNVTLTLGNSLQADTGYTLRVNNVQDVAGNAIAANSTRTFMLAGITAIADIHDNFAIFDSTVVTVEAQVYIPTDYRNNSPTSGYIQDSSGRGINVFGSGGNVPALQDVGNIVRVTGRVVKFFDTVEIESISSVELVSSGNPPLQATMLSTSAANSSSWEGTYIEVTGTISSLQTGVGGATNYTVNDGSGAIIVRVVDVLGAPAFSNGQTITARGAGSQFQIDFQILVGRTADIFLDGGGGDTTPPQLVSVTVPTDMQIDLAFNEALDAVSAETVGNYAVWETASPANTVPVSGATLLPGAQQTVQLALGAALQDGVRYTVRLGNIEDLAGNAMLTTFREFTFGGGGVEITPIADIQANPSAFQGQTVTVEGQVYIPTDFRNNDPTTGYIQDGSGRGINVFGFSAEDPLLEDIGNVVRLTGEVDIFNTTVEIVNLTDVTLVSSGNPPFQPIQLSTGAAASPSWEGTYIEVTGPITNVSLNAGPADNYTVNDGTGSIDVRIHHVLNLSFQVGQRITARGAGSQFAPTFQILVGNVEDVFVDGGGEDTTPPQLVSVTAPNDTRIDLAFNEALDPVSAETTGNYAVWESDTPANVVPLSGATLQGTQRSVQLGLGAALQDGVRYTVQVENVEDLAGNAMSTTSREFTFGSGGVVITPIADIHANFPAFDGQTVTVQGQVYIPTDYRGSTTSGYIQDGSGRGINLFGNGANNAALRDVSNIVRLTGTVTAFFTTIEVENITSVQLISSGNPPLEPRTLRTGAANDAAWEGTFIEVTGQIIFLNFDAGGADNYSVDDGSGPIDVRVVHDLSMPRFELGQIVTARGAGSRFQDTFQLLVGRAEDMFEFTLPEASRLTLKGPPFTFVPGIGETYIIEVDVPLEMQQQSDLVLRVLDLQGRVRRTLVDTRRGGFVPPIEWTGRDDSSELVPAGTYIVHLLVINRVTGARDQLQMPVVVATRLAR